MLDLNVARAAWQLPPIRASWSLDTGTVHRTTNLFFADGKVSAIIDWDQAYTAPRAWGILRVLHYVGKLDPDFCRAFLAAYRQVLPLPQDELNAAAEVYGWLQAHNLWVYEELYLRGNARVRGFLEPHGRFVPFAESWALVITSL